MQDPKDAFVQTLQQQIDELRNEMSGLRETNGALRKENEDLRKQLQVRWVASSVAGAMHVSASFHRGMLTGRCFP
jgi:regulator of replication initiation timing